MSVTRTTCPYCGVGCGVIATRGQDGKVAVRGDPDHPANLGRLCSKGLALGETLGLDQRLLHPQVFGRRASWDDATALVAAKFQAAIAEHGPDSVAFYVSGQFLTEDYYVANKLMKGFIGSANIDSNSRLCMASAVAGHKRAFGADVVPCNYEDLEQADLVVLVGSNLAWCHPVLFQRLQAARERRGTRLVVIDPRRTATAEASDLHLAIRPQSDVALFNGLFRHLYSTGEIDGQFVSKHTSNVSAALISSNYWTPDKAAAACGLAPRQVRQFFSLFSRSARTVTAFSMGVNQSANGTDKVNAIINCHLLTGRIGKPGAGPFSLTGQPNAMGGREVGGLSNMLAAHMDIDDASHRAALGAFWQAPRVAEKAGLKAVDLFKAVKGGHIKALWIMATNPAVSMPQADGVAEALKACPFVVVSDVTASTETARHAHVLLPALGWGEKEGTVTNSERRISRQRSFLRAPGEARADWHIMAGVATAMGFPGFDYGGPAAIFAEHVALSGLGNDGVRAFDLSAWASEDYAAMPPRQWGGAQPFADGQFQTASGKAQFVATHHVAAEPQAMVLNTGRIRDQWHTMTRTGLSPRLFGHRAEPFVEINPADAARLGITKAGLVEITSEGGASVVRALITDAVREGEAFMPMHWSGPFANAALANLAVAATADPVSGQPALKSGEARLAAFRAAWHGFGLCLEEYCMEADYFARRPLATGMAFECAGLQRPADWLAHLRMMDGDLTVVQSKIGESFRCVVLRDGRMQFAFFASKDPVEASRAWLQGQLGMEVHSLAVLAGRPAGEDGDGGAILCACNSVGVNSIACFIRSNPNMALEKICTSTGAGTGCGSCRTEIRRMLNDASKQLAAAE